MPKPPPATAFEHVKEPNSPYCGLLGSIKLDGKSAVNSEAVVIGFDGVGVDHWMVPDSRVVWQVSAVVNDGVGRLSAGQQHRRLVWRDA